MGNKLRQVKTLMRKNLLLLRRNKRSTFLQLLAPFTFMILLLGIQSAVVSGGDFSEIYKKEHSPDVKVMQDIPKCQLRNKVKKCYDFAVVPKGSPVVEDVVAQIGKNAGVDYEVLYFDAEGELIDWVKKNQNATQGAYVFHDVDATTTPEEFYSNIQYTLYYNQTVSTYNAEILNPYTWIGLPLQAALDRALLPKAVGKNNLVYDVYHAEFAHPALIPYSAMATAGPAFLFGAIMFSFVVFLGQIVAEKEMKLRDGMRTMGLKDSVFWSTWFLTDMIFVVSTTFLIIISGFICNFNFFTKNAFGTYFFLFLLFAMSMMALAFMLTTMLSKSETATTLGFFLFLVGSFFQSLTPVIYENFPEFAQYICALFPPIVFAKGVLDLSQYSNGQGATGIAWSDISSYTTTFNLSVIYRMMIFDFFLFVILTWYLDNVLPGSGNPKPYFFFLNPSYWTGKHHSNAGVIERTALLQVDENRDDDVLEEEGAVKRGETGDAAVVFRGLLKKYSDRSIFGHGSEYIAVRGLWTRMQSGKLFALLGPNGAGKSTTINMLTGMFGPTSGDATVFGHSICSEMDDIQKVMGVCPQFDILWPELTGREHLEIFAALKGIEPHLIDQEVQLKLKQVSLLEAADARSSSYSGGMRRRLSVAVALIGDPKIVVLDEPTTGMDPVSRREVWNVIEIAKQNRVVLLTTHSMEEADILGDTIAIMAKGSLRCIGSSIRLKNKFGAGYVITTITSQPQKVKEFMLQYIPEAIIQSELEEYLIFIVPREAASKMPDFFEKFEEKAEELSVTDVQLSLTTLEEVFLKIAHEAEDEELQKIHAMAQPFAQTASGNMPVHYQPYGSGQHAPPASGAYQPPGTVPQSVPTTPPPDNREQGWGSGQLVWSGTPSKEGHLQNTEEQK